jgi:hypothetical protein
MDESDVLIARAALAGPKGALLAWQQWREQHSIAAASGLLVWAGGYIHRNLRDAGVDDAYLAGIHRYNWVRNNGRVVAALPTIRALSERWTIVPLKSFGMSSETYSRGLRPLADFDFYVDERDAPAVREFLLARDFAGLLDVAQDEFLHRVMPQRGSWNFLDESGTDLDLHWRLLEHLEARASRRLVEANSRLTDTEFVSVRILDDELLLVCIITHHVLGGSTALNGLFDAYHLMKTVDMRRTARLAAEVGAARDLRDVCTALRSIIGDEAHPKLGELERAIVPHAARQPAQGETRSWQPLAPVPSRYREDFYLARPRIYRAWTALGALPWIERLLIRAFGPFTRAEAQEHLYGPMGPTDEIPAGGGTLGPGWHYRYPVDPHRWANVPDTRIRFSDVTGASRVRIRLTADQWQASQVGAFSVFCNGRRIGTCDRDCSDFEFELSPDRDGEVEISLRPLRRSVFADPGIHAQWYRMLAPIAAITLS